MTKAARFSEAAYTEHDNGRLDQTGHHQFAAIDIAIMRQFIAGC
jgi:hypothetical protein